MVPSRISPSPKFKELCHQILTSEKTTEPYSEGLYIYTNFLNCNCLSIGFQIISLMIMYDILFTLFDGRFWFYRISLLNYRTLLKMISLVIMLKMISNMGSDFVFTSFGVSYGV